MKFYIIAFFLAYLQSSVMVAIFHNMLIAPDFLLLYLFLSILRQDTFWLRRTFLAGFFLDIFQDSLGLNMSGYLLFAILLNFIKHRFEIPGRISIILVYIPISLLEKLWIIFLFRLRYYADLNLWLGFSAFLLELLILYFVSGRFINNKS